ncbi:MAG: relaxase [Ahrensia sp.]|nr:relaxase [Ahrensia sp.]
MILKGNQRAGGGQLAAHLTNILDNEHVAVHELRGFMADDLHGALNEAYAISRGTKCRQFLFSVSLNPPETENVPVDVFEAAIADIEEKLSLTDQPRAIVFHEKEGRRHAHCVWSRINVDEMKAINLPHYKLKLRDISRGLYLQHQWKMPRGLANSEERDPLNFSLEEWQQAKRLKVDPRKIKEAMQDAWAMSDSVSAFANALRELGFWLARGDRRGHVAVDINGNVFAIARSVGVRARDIRARLGEADTLPSVEETRSVIHEAVANKLNTFVEMEHHKVKMVDEVFQLKRRKLVDRQRQIRQEASDALTQRRTAENKQRTARLPTGLKALWFRATGKYRNMKKQIELEAMRCDLRDRVEMARLVQQQLTERRRLKCRHVSERSSYTMQLSDLFDEVAQHQSMGDPNPKQARSTAGKRKLPQKRSRSP